MYGKMNKPQFRIIMEGDKVKTEERVKVVLRKSDFGLFPIKPYFRKWVFIGNVNSIDDVPDKIKSKLSARNAMLGFDKFISCLFGSNNIIESISEYYNEKYNY